MKLSKESKEKLLKKCNYESWKDFDNGKLSFIVRAIESFPKDPIKHGYGSLISNSSIIEGKLNYSSRKYDSLTVSLEGPSNLELPEGIENVRVCFGPSYFDTNKFRSEVSFKFNNINYYFYRETKLKFF